MVCLCLRTISSKLKITDNKGSLFDDGNVIAVDRCDSYSYETGGREVELDVFGRLDVPQERLNRLRNSEQKTGRYCAIAKIQRSSRPVQYSIFIVKI